MKFPRRFQVAGFTYRVDAPGIEPGSGLNTIVLWPSNPFAPDNLHTSFPKKVLHKRPFREYKYNLHDMQLYFICGGS